MADINEVVTVATEVQTVTRRLGRYSSPGTRNFGVRLIVAALLLIYDKLEEIRLQLPGPPD